MVHVYLKRFLHHLLKSGTALGINFHPAALTLADPGLTLKRGGSESVNIYTLHCRASPTEASGSCLAQLLCKDLIHLSMSFSHGANGRQVLGGLGKNEEPKCTGSG